MRRGSHRAGPAAADAPPPEGGEAAAADPPELKKRRKGRESVPGGRKLGEYQAFLSRTSQYATEETRRQFNFDRTEEEKRRDRQAVADAKLFGVDYALKEHKEQVKEARQMRRDMEVEEPRTGVWLGMGAKLRAMRKDSREKAARRREQEALVEAKLQEVWCSSPPLLETIAGIHAAN